MRALHFQDASFFENIRQTERISAILQAADLTFL